MSEKPKKKMGRPTTSPKGKSIHVRLDKPCQEVLDRYTEQEGVAQTEAIRRGIMKLENDLK